MVDLRVIEGGGGDGGDGATRIAEERAAWALERLAVEMLRGIARGGESANPVGSALAELHQHLRTEGARLYPAIQAGLQTVNDRLIPDDDRHEEDLCWLLRAAIRLTAEKLATDGFARGRASRRQSDLTHALEQYILHKEERAESTAAAI